MGMNLSSFRAAPLMAAPQGGKKGKAFYGPASRGDHEVPVTIMFILNI